MPDLNSKTIHLFIKNRCTVKQYYIAKRTLINVSFHES